MGLDLDVANDVQFTPLIGGETVDVTDRKSVGKVRLDLTAAQEVAFDVQVLAATTSTFGMIHGAEAGKKVLVFLPSVQLINKQKDEINGRRLISYDLRLVPVAGNDEIVIIFF